MYDAFFHTASDRVRFAGSIDKAWSVFYSVVMPRAKFRAYCRENGITA